MLRFGLRYQRLITSAQLSSRSSKTHDYLIEAGALQKIQHAHRPASLEKSPSTSVRHKMRGRYAITKTKWWLERGPILIPDVAAINLEYNKPSVDEYGLSKGAHIYNTFYIPQLRYKNPNVQVDVRTNMTAVPFMQIYFKDGRSTTVNCAASAEEIASHIQGTFCLTKAAEENRDFNEDGRLQNPWLHPAGKPCCMSDINRVHRKCICQQPGHFGCSVNMRHMQTRDERKALTQRSAHNLPVEDNLFNYRLRSIQYERAERAHANRYEFYRKKGEDSRFYAGPDGFRKQIEETKRVEEIVKNNITESMNGRDTFRLVKRLSQKVIHEHWCTYFWQCEHGLSGDMKELRDEHRRRTIYLAQKDSMRGGFDQLHRIDRKSVV